MVIISLDPKVLNLTLSVCVVIRKANRAATRCQSQCRPTCYSLLHGESIVFISVAAAGRKSASQRICQSHVRCTSVDVLGAKPNRTHYRSTRRRLICRTHAAGRWASGEKQGAGREAGCSAEHCFQTVADGSAHATFAPRAPATSVPSQRIAVTTARC